MNQPVTIGIDVATAGVRALAVRGGTVLASAAAPLPAPVRDGRGRSEQDARSWWPAVKTVLAKVTGELPGRGGEVAAVAVAATSGTIVGVGASGEPVTPALMYDDRRGAELNREATELGADRWRRLGFGVSATAALGRIAWLAGHVPGVTGIRHTPDLIAAELTGGPVAADWSHALKSGYDPLALEWPGEVFDALGVPEGLLPSVVSPATVLGEVARPVAGLPAGCRVVAGMTDGCAGQLAAGAVTPGSFVGILGTTYVLKGVTEELVPDPTGAMYSHRHPDGWWLPGGASNTGGEAVAGQERLPELDEAAAARGPAKIVAYPLRRKGERFPFTSADAEGFVSGEADEVELHRARLEGVAFLERLALDHLRRLGVTITDPLLAAGGGSKSPLWTRIRATVTGLGLRVSPQAETGYGAALLGAAGVLPGGLAEASAGLGKGVLVEPDERESAALAESYRRFCTELHTRGWIDDELFAVAQR
ncbi:FGGY-family carbohydrate kinase [Amycolatopsis roodepoortensis]|uniref:Sugar (Pentulose or hexulose) kinase n=1 Tax=Amycolatopsis roodepoortensis TaxID=700274 RepID=A0ABR9L823_9PSEU|nr:FGGY family carbohydrate kinase [Amycolatopsis roodepoortensis]MBE1576720.1 sugar (pentulose or hexulose) kinase [Amycolatopsis roodepoortensis]